MTATLEFVQGDITRASVDAIVNAANSSLLGGGGVDGAIHRAGGPAILAECRLIRERSGRLAPGQAVLTTAGLLPCRYVIHTVGPIWQGGTQGEPETLASCYVNSLALAAQHGLASVAFPSISTGAYGYPVERAAAIAVRSVRAELTRPTTLQHVRFVLFSAADLATYRQAADAG